MPNMPSLDADWRQLVTGGVEAAVMTALLSDAPGKADSLRVGTMPRPTPGAGQVRLKVAVAGLNFPDALIIEDRYQIRPPRPFSPGIEVAGIVDEVGEGVEDRKRTRLNSSH